MSKFTYISKPLGELISTNKHNIWIDGKEESFTKLKEEIPSTRVLAFHDTAG